MGTQERSTRQRWGTTSPEHPPMLSSRHSAAFSPSPRPQLTKRGGNRRGLGGARPFFCSDWLMQLSILNLFLMEGGTTRSAPDHVCHPQPNTLVQVRGQEAIGD